MLNVLSLFDGMSCGQIALDRLGIKVDTYFASEIDKHAIKVTQANYPNTIQLGDVCQVNATDLPPIDLLLAGSPCQGFSFAGKQLAFDDDRSKLFFEFVRIWEEVKAINPEAKFLLENVKMKQEHEAVISRYMGNNPIEINSALVSAQNRQRLYWTNIGAQPDGLFGHLKCFIPQPENKGMLLRDILEEEVDDKYFLSDKMLNYLVSNSSLQKENGNGFKYAPTMVNEKEKCVTSKEGQRMDDNFIIASCGRNPQNPKSREAGLPTEQMLEPRLDGKTNCLTSVQKDNLVFTKNYLQYDVSGKGYKSQQDRAYYEDGKHGALSSARADTKNGVLITEATKKGYVEIQPGECFDGDNPASKTRRGRKMEDKTNCLMAKKTDFMQLTKSGRIRRLTPVECERLQTVEDNYTNHVSDTQRYKMLGNGWTVDVIVHILGYMDVDQIIKAKEELCSAH